MTDDVRDLNPNSPRDIARVRAELDAAGQDPDIPWPPPPNWDSHRVRVLLEREIHSIEAALADFHGMGVQKAFLQSHLRHLRARWRRWKLVTFFAGWRPWPERLTT